MRVATRRDINLAIPGLQNSNRQMRGCAKAKKSNPLAGFNPRHAQAAKTNDAGAQQWRGVQIIQFPGELEYKVVARRCILRVAAVDGISRKDRSIAKIFQSAAAIRAGSVYTSDPGNSNPSADRQVRRSALDYVAHNLVAGD